MKARTRLFLGCVVSMFSLVHLAHTDTFTVTTTNHTGVGSLRQAILDANASGGPDIIDFNIPSGGLTISLTNALPTITDPVTISATNQPGFAGMPIVELNGQSAGAGVDGLKISAGSSTIRGLIINRFAGDGIELSTNGNNVIEGCFIGLSVGGITNLANSQNGIFITNSANNTIGGTIAAAQNFISGNSQNGVNITGTNATNNLVVGNVVGLNFANAARANGANGILLNSAPFNTIGGTPTTARNVISANSSDGIEINGTNATGNVIQGNYIGTDPGGTLDLGNSADGIFVTSAPGNIIGGASAGAGNLISGNNSDGIELTGAPSAFNQIFGNTIGATITGTAALANGQHGVQITSNARTSVIGGLTVGAGNVIAFNGQDGVYVSAGTNNAVRANTVFSNGGATAGNLGIDLGTSGVTVNDTNDVDTGANQLQNFPVLTNALATATDTTIQGYLNSRASTVFGLDFFANRAADTAGHGEGQQYLGSTNVTTAADGTNFFSVTLPAVITGRFLTATATDPDGNTSEFSLALLSSSTIPGSTFTVINTNDSGAGSLRQAILDSNQQVNGPNNLIQFTLGAGPYVISPATALPALTEPVTIDGYTQLGSAVNTLTNGDNAVILVRLDGVNAGGGSEGLTLQASGCIVRGLAITRFNGEGIQISGNGALLQGNFIGIDVDGTNGLPNGQNGILITGAGSLIGGTTPGVRNLISGNNSGGGDGIEISGAGASNNVVAGNYIGTDKSGTLDKGNGQDGVLISLAPNNTVGGANATARNLISGNNSEGVTISGTGASGNQVLNNYIGVDVTGTVAMGNGSHGVFFTTGFPSGNVVGSVNPGGNIIAFNNGDGVYVSAGTNNAVRANTVFSNGGATAGNLGIDLGTSGVTVNDTNDVDTGANQLQNFPVLTNALATATDTTIQGYLNSRASTVFGLDFFANRAADTAGHGEGQQYLGSTNVTTAADGTNFFSVTLPAVITGRFLTATATDPDGNTSEFSLALLSSSTIPGSTFTVINTNDSGAGSLRQAILDSNQQVNGPNNLIQFTLGAGPYVISPATALPALTEPVTIDGYTQLGSAVNTLTNGDNAVILVRLDGVNAGGGSEGLTLQASGCIVRGLAITRFNGEGIQISGNGALLQGNFIGIDVDGTNGLPNGQNGILITGAGSLIGGTTPGVRNLISGNNSGGGDGIEISGAGASNNVVAGNYIGTDKSGTLDKGNGQDGVLISLAPNNTVGGANATARNLISGNNSEGVTISGTGASGNQVLNNYIGVDVTGTVAMGNGSHGVFFTTGFPSGNVVGSVNPGGNIIAFNNGDGVYVSAGTNNAVRANTVFSNGGATAGNLGIDLGTSGVTVNDTNDVDTGANQLQNFPVLTNALATATDTTIQGYLNSRASTVFGLDFFANRAADTAGHGEGQQYLGSTNVTTAADGTNFFSVTLPAVITGRFLTATATDPDGNTSEFSLALLSSSTIPGSTFTVINTNDSGAGSLRQAILDSNQQVNGPNNLIQFTLGAGPYVISPATALPALTEPVTIDGYTQLGSAVNTLTNGDNAVILVRLDGVNIPGFGTDGLRLNSRGNVIRGLSITRFTGEGIETDANGFNTIEGNFIGLDVDGTNGLANSSHGVYLNTSPGNTIGGATLAARNVISANFNNGVQIMGANSRSNVVAGNYIGTDRTGALDRGNSGDGVNVQDAGTNTIGGLTAVARNLISGNSGSGVEIVQSFGQTSTGNQIIGNYIGPDVTGTNDLGNSSEGVLISAPGNAIGGAAAAAGNRVAFNDSHGIRLSDGTNNAVRGNAIFNNSILGIDLGFDFTITANDTNDVDTGANQLQNFPLISGATITPASTTIAGSLNSQPNTVFTVDFFASVFADASGSGEGQQYLGSTNVTTGADGTNLFNVALPAVAIGRQITATATDPFGNTSEFSPAFAATSTFLPKMFTVRNTNDNGPESLRQAILDNNATASGSNNLITFNITTGVGPHTIAPSNALPTITEPVTIDGYTQTGATTNTLANGFNASLQIRLEGTNAGFSSANGLRLAAPGSIVRGLAITRFPGFFSGDGIEIATSNCVIEGNVIGLGLDGTALGNLGSGVNVFGSGNRIGGIGAGARNVISGNSGHGITVNGTGATGNSIQGNFIGIDPTGALDRGNSSAGVNLDTSGNIVGGTAAGARNVISGNTVGITINFGTMANVVQGNFIGTDAAGTNRVANSGNGVSVFSSTNTVVGGTAAGAGNLISGNNGDGVRLTSSTVGATVQGNRIGTDLSGMLALENFGSGVGIDNSSFNTVGGTNAGAANIVAFNTYGVAVLSGATNNSVRANVIFSNNALGIDLGQFSFTDSVTANDPGDVDTVGGNLLQNFPVLTNAVANPTTTLVQGTLDSTASATFAIDFYSNPDLDSSGHGEGKTWLGSTAVTTDGSGLGTFNVTLPAAIVGRYITATATDPNGNTSEFSESFTPVYNLPPKTFVVRNTNDSGPESLREALLAVDAEGASGNDLVTFEIPGSGVRTIQLLTALSTPQDPVTIDGFSQSGASANTSATIDNAVRLVRLDGTNANFISGLTFTNVGNVVRGLEITGFDRYAIEITGGGSNVVDGCLIISNGSGGISISDSPGNRIGGATPPARNVISANSFTGILIQNAPSLNNLVQGNLIGTDATGSLDLGNFGAGIQINNASSNTIGGVTAGARNVISGNNSGGVSVGGFGADVPTANRIQGNYIGTDATGASGVTNGVAGVSVSFGVGTIIGGTGAGEANLIAFNGGDGVQVSSASSSNNVVRANSIFSNGGATANSLGIDLFGSNGVTQNDAAGGDADAGGNLLQNFPVVTNATLTASNVIVQGTLNSSPGAAFQVDFYANLVCDPSGNGEGRFWLGALAVNTGADSNAVINTTFAPPAQGRFITATATDASGNTSEFCACRQMGSAIPPLDLEVSNVNDSGTGSLRQAIIDNNNSFTASNNLIRFNIAAGSGIRVISPLSPLPDITAPVTIDGYTQPGASMNTLSNGSDAVLLIRLDGASAGAVGVDGLRFTSHSNVVRGLIITRFSGDGIEVAGAGGDVITGNWIGTDGPGGAAGIAPAGLDPDSLTGLGISRSVRRSGSIRPHGSLFLGNGAEGLNVGGPNVIVGGPNFGDRNVFSDNALHGICIMGGPARDALVINNYSGTDVFGTSQLGNGVNGLLVDGAPGADIIGNIFSGNLANGLEVRGSGGNDILIIRNGVGIGADGGPLGNGENGLLVGNNVFNNTIGGSTPANANVFANNGQAGLRVLNSFGGNDVLINSTVNNNQLGLDIGPTGVNTGSPFPPTITGVTPNGSTVQIDGNVNALSPGNFPIFVFGNPLCDPSGRGEGQTYLGTTVAVVTGPGTTPFSAIFPVPPGAVINEVTAFLSGEGITTEFGQCFPVTTGPSDVALVKSGPLSAVTPGIVQYDLLLTGGANSATGVTLQDTFPGNLLFLRSPGFNPSPSGGTLDFNLGTLPAGQNRTVPIQFFAFQSGQTINNGTVTTGSTDPNSANNASATTTQITPISPPLPDVVFPAANWAFGPHNGQPPVTFPGTSEQIEDFFMNIPSPPNLPAVNGTSSTFSRSVTPIISISHDGGMTFQPVNTTGNVLGQVTRIGTSGNETFFAIEIVQLNLTGGGLPPGTMLRESPTRYSQGPFVTDSGFANSFFDIFVEISLDGGTTWNPANTFIRDSLDSALDFGDAPLVAPPVQVPPFPSIPFGYPVASHAIVPNLMIGAAVDLENASQPTPRADGDDVAGDDEEGIVFLMPMENDPIIGFPVPMLLTGLPTGTGNDIQITLSVPAGQQAFLSAWIDFNRDGDWNDPGEEVIDNQPFAVGVQTPTIGFTAPAGIVSGLTFARFRLTTANNIGPAGAAPDGEVHDLMIRLVADFDFGDAPDRAVEPSYPTRLANDGPRHAIGGTGPYLGAGVDPDVDVDPNDFATTDDVGDSNDDEDGITFLTPLNPGVIAQLAAVASTAARLDGWIDFNADGDWNDAGERVFNNQSLSLGTNILACPVPAGAGLGSTFARFRISRQGGLDFTGFAADGEVEDYQVAISPSGPRVESVAVLPSGQVEIRWTGGAVLQRAPTATGPWADDLTATNPFVLTPTTGPGAEFFRLRQ